MSENSTRDAFGLTEPKTGVSRRGVVTAAAWAVPVVSLSMATPALAASTPPITTLTLRFSKPIYTTAPSTNFAGAEAVQIVLLDTGSVPVPGATVSLTILEADASDGDNDGEDDNGSDDDIPTEAWFIEGGVQKKTITVTTLGDGTYTAVVLAGAGGGSLPINATLVALPAGKTGTATAESILRITEILEIWSWGDGGSGALGTGTTRSSRVPVGVAFPASVNSIKAIYPGEHRRAFAIDDTNKVWAWGSDSHSNLFGLSSKERYVPADVTAQFPSTVKQIDGGYYVTYALLENGDLYGWGYNAYDAFFQKTGGTKPSTYQKTPIRLNLERSTTPLPSPIAKIAATRHNPYLLLENGEVWTWGRNYLGSLGRGTTAASTQYILAPVQGLPAGDPVVDIDARYYGATVITESGAVYSWGLNDYGECGDGTVGADRGSAVKVNVPGKAVGVYASWRNAGVVMEDGRAYVWGRGANYGLGNSSTSNSGTPVLQSFNSPVKSLAMGNQTMHALLANGVVMGWGRNSSGQVGDGKTSVVKTPVAVIGLPAAAISIAETQYTSYAAIQGN